MILLSPNHVSAKTLRTVLHDPIVAFDTHKDLGVSTHDLMANTMEGLVRISPEGTVLPGLAKSWNTEDDQKRLIFHLRAAFWSDGKPVLAEHFVTGIARALSPKTNYFQASILYPINNAQAFNTAVDTTNTVLGVEALGPSTLEITLHHADALFIRRLSYLGFMPLRDDIIAQWASPHGSNKPYPSTGPFYIHDVSPESDRTVLRRNPHYWDRDSVMLDEIVAVLLPKDQLITHFIDKEVDLIAPIYTGLLENFPQELEQNIDIWPRFSTSYFSFSSNSKTMKNPKLREALNLALDREALVDAIQQSSSLPAYSLIPPVFEQYPNSEFEWHLNDSSDPIQLAREAYKEAGFSDTNPASLNIHVYAGYPAAAEIAELVVNQWRDHLGIKIDFDQSIAWQDYLKKRNEETLGDMHFYGWRGDYFDPLAYLENFSSGGGVDRLNVPSEAFDALLSEARFATSDTNRFEHLSSAEKLLLKHNIVFPAVFKTFSALVQTNVKGWELSPIGWIDYKQVSVEPE